MRLEQLHKALATKHVTGHKADVVIDLSFEDMKYWMHPPYKNINDRVKTGTTIDICPNVPVIGEEEINVINMIRSVMG